VGRISAARIFALRDVGLGSFSEVSARKRNVSSCWLTGMSERCANNRGVLFNHLVGAGEKRGWDFEPERFGRTVSPCPVTSYLPRSTDFVRPARLVRFVP